MTDILQRLALRAKNLTPSYPSAISAGIRPRTHSRYEGLDDRPFSSENTDTAIMPTEPGTINQANSPEISPQSRPMAPKPVSAQPSSPVRKPIPPAHTNSVPPPLHPLKPSPVRVERKAEASGNIPPPFSANVQKQKGPNADQTPIEAKVAPARTPPPQKADTRQSRKQSPESSQLPDRLQSPVQPAAILQTLAASAPGNGESPGVQQQNTSQPPDVVIQIDRIDVQVDKAPEKPARQAVRKTQLTDLSNYLSGTGDRR